MTSERIEHVHRCDPAHTALLVVDMQRGFLDPGAALEVSAGREIVPAIGRLVDCCRTVGAPVIFTQFVYSTAVPCLRGDPFGIEHLPALPGEPTGYGRPSSNCLIGPLAGQGADSAEVVPALAPRPDELVIAGHTYDKFLGTPLDLALRSRGVTHVLVTGVDDRRLRQLHRAGRGQSQLPCDGRDGRDGHDRSRAARGLLANLGAEVRPPANGRPNYRRASPAALEPPYGVVCCGCQPPLRWPAQAVYTVGFPRSQPVQVIRSGRVQWRGNVKCAARSPRWAIK